MKQQPFSIQNEKFGLESAGKRRISDEEVEDEQKEAEEEKDGGAVDAAARKARDGAHERNWDGFEARFLADGVERSGRRVTRKITTEKGKFVLEPHGEIAAAAPRQPGASQEKEIAENG